MSIVDNLVIQLTTGNALCTSKFYRSEQTKLLKIVYKNFVQPTITYAATTQGQEDNFKQPTSYDVPSGQRQQNAFQFMNAECNKLFGSEVFDILNKIKLFIPRYTEISDQNEKQKQLFMFMFELINIP